MCPKVFDVVPIDAYNAIINFPNAYACWNHASVIGQSLVGGTLGCLSHLNGNRSHYLCSPLVHYYTGSFS